MTPAPIPPPSAGEYFHCGQELQFTEFCPACGARLQRQRRRWTVQRVAVLMMATIVTLGAGWAGTCSALFVAGEGIREIGVPATVGYYCLVPSVAVFVLGLRWIRSILQNKSTP
ncbi:MAG TPA: hypothetical protein VF600_09355 [Abditibacteriaceae bacterium]